MEEGGLGIEGGGEGRGGSGGGGGEEPESEGHPEGGRGPEVELACALDEDLAEAGLLEEGGEGGDGVCEGDEFEVLGCEESCEGDLREQGDALLADALEGEPGEAASGSACDACGAGGAGGRGGV